MYTCAMWMVRLLAFDIRGIHSLFLSLHRWNSASIDNFRVLLPVNVMNTVVSLLDLYSQCLTEIILVACVTVTQQLLVCSVGFCPTDEGAYEVPCAVITVGVMSSFEVLLHLILLGIGLHAPRMQTLEP